MPIGPRAPRIHLKQPLKIDARFPLRFTGLLANPSIPHRLKQSFIHLLRASLSPHGRETEVTELVGTEDRVPGRRGAVFTRTTSQYERASLTTSAFVCHFFRAMSSWRRLSLLLTNLHRMFEPSCWANHCVVFEAL